MGSSPVLHVVTHHTCCGVHISITFEQEIEAAVSEEVLTLGHALSWCHLVQGINDQNRRPVTGNCLLYRTEYIDSKHFVKLIFIPSVFCLSSYYLSHVL